MTDKQFHIIRNLLTWIVICLLLLISHSFGALDNYRFVEFLGETANILVLVFLLMMGFRFMVACFPEDEKNLSSSEEDRPST